MGLGYTKQPVKAHVSNVKTSRAWNTNYHNTTGRPLLVIVTGAMYRSAVAAATAGLEARIGVTSPALDLVSVISLKSVDSVAEYIVSNLIFVVPNNYYYQVIEGVAGAGSRVDKDGRIEVEL